MLSISSGHSAEYLTGQVAVGRESYYSGAVVAGEPPGVWSGRGAELLGLSGAVDTQDMTALYEHRLDPRDDRFQQPAEWGQAPTLGGPLRRYTSTEEAYQRALAAEPDASPERREELRLNAERSARRNVQFLDATFSAPKSVTVLAVAFLNGRWSTPNAPAIRRPQARGRRIGTRSRPPYWPATLRCCPICKTSPATPGSAYGLPAVGVRPP